MSEWWQLLAVFLLAANPAGAASAMAVTLPNLDMGTLRWRLAGAAVATAVVLFALATVLAEPVHDLFDVEPETFSLAAGIVLLIAAAQMIWRGHAGFRDAPGDWKAGIYPLGLPLVASPALLVAALNWGGDPDAGVGLTLAMGLPAIVVAVAVAVLAPSRYGGWLNGVSRLTGVLLGVAAVALAVTGIETV